MKKIIVSMFSLCLFISCFSTVTNAQNRSLSTSIMNTHGQIIGTATIVEEQNGVKIHVKASNLPPGTHGIHIHENGDCTPPDFKKSGAHFNPTKHQHGFDNPKGYHSGDLPNIVVDAEGKVDVVLETKDVTLKKGKQNSILKKSGTSLIIHEKEDDYVTDPAGNSGDRIACAVINK